MTLQTNHPNSKPTENSAVKSGGAPAQSDVALQEGAPTESGVSLLKFEGEVLRLSTEGFGVVKHPSGLVFFVPGTWPGDRGVFEIKSQEKRYGYAVLAELLSPSPDRVPVPCVYQGLGAQRCGGCPWMIGSYESQLAHKERRVRHALERAGLLEIPERFKSILGSELTLGYRNRAQFKTDGTRLGFVSEGSHDIVEIEECLVLNEPMAAHLQALKAELPKPAWKPGPNYTWNFIDLDEKSETTDAPLNVRRPFRQGNSVQNQRMKDWISERIGDLDPKAPVLELFAGSGNFTELFVNAGFKRIVATEIADQSLSDLKARAWPGVTTFRLDLAHVKNYSRLSREYPETKVLFLDPPREGAKGVEALAQQLRKLETIFYVSCDTATFTRDAAKLHALGFDLAEVQPLDLFPHTAHVEILSMFRKR